MTNMQKYGIGDLTWVKLLEVLKLIRSGTEIPVVQLRVVLAAPYKSGLLICVDLREVHTYLLFSPVTHLWLLRWRRKIFLIVNKPNFYKNKY